ncbi:MAG: sulfatase-like hydrolase/transferase [Candidatus Latescibacteria bacterium]|nr:sulfatase-like hydrolase/transferase [Candidatus Latescibacterota bacterium]
MADRPNILFAIADDASHFSAYGHTFVDTPHFDRVAADGIRFNNAFTTNPKCAPSRASILTGRHTWQNREACQHWNFWPDGLAVFPDLLEAAGYHVGFTGKGWAPGDWQRCGRGRNPAGPHYNERRLEPPDGSKISGVDYAGNFADFLADRPQDAPFYFWYGGHEPHRHYTPGEGLAHGKRMEQVEQVPPYWPEEDVVRRDMLDYAFETEWFDAQLGKMLALLEQRGELDNTLVVVTSDNGAPFPRVKGNMYEDDFRLPCAVMWPQGIEGGRQVDDLVSFTDLAPTFLEAAEAASLDDCVGRSLFDIFAASGSGMVTPDRQRVYMGRERHDMGREDDLGYPVRCMRTSQYLYVRNFAPERWPAGNPETGYTGCDSSPTKARILTLKEEGQDECWRLAFGKRPLEELYDIVADSHCLENLAGRADMGPLKEKLWGELRAELERSGDPRIEGRGDIFEQYDYVGEAQHSWAHYLKGDWQPQKY